MAGALIAILSLISAMEPEVMRLDSSRCHFFAEYQYTWTEYLALSSTGRYAWIDCQHMGVDLHDTGTWRQLPSGVVELRSERRVRDVEAPPLSIGLFLVKRDGQAAFLEAIQGAIAHLLRDHPQAAFSLATVRGAYRPPGWKIPAIDLLDWEPDSSQQITRENLSDLLAAIEDFLAANDQNVFRFTPLRLGSDTFIEWHNTGVLADRDRYSEMSMLYQYRFGEYPATVFTHVPLEIFARGAGTTQPIMFHPEMNTYSVPDQLPVVAEITAECTRP